jgi:hypothetical protein
VAEKISKGNGVVHVGANVGIEEDFGHKLFEPRSRRARGA